jgi:HNH endonuclease
MTLELWKTVGEYRVSSHGRVLSKRTKGYMKPGANNSGHLFLYLGRGNKRYVHRLVLETFIGPCPPGMECLHSDNDPSNNKLDNLKWGTRSDNVKALLKAHPGLRSRQSYKMWETRRAR